MSTAAHIASSSGMARHPVITYFALTYAISWTGALLVVAPHLVHHQHLTRLDGILMFPAMLLGPPIAGIILTRKFYGSSGLRDLLARMRRVRIAAQWWPALLIPPAIVLAVLFSLRTLDSPVFRPGFFPMGIAFGCLAGFLEEIGWTGFAYPQMLQRGRPFRAALILGVLWGLWHLPVINFLGTASPHRSAWPEFAAAFIMAMIALRILIAWLYLSTHSIPIAQLMHAASTASLAMFSPFGVNSIQEAFWYALYGAGLWAIVLLIYLMVFRRKTAIGNL